MRRGNLEKEALVIGERDRVKNECVNTGLQRLVRAYEKILRRPKREVPKQGRPKLPDWKKARRKQERDFKKTK